MQTIVSKLLAIAATSREVAWNARGAGYISLRPFLDDVYSESLGWVDTFGEHMASTGVYGNVEYEPEHRNPFPQLLVRKDPNALTTGLRELFALLDGFTESLDEQLANQTDDPVGQAIVADCLLKFNRFFSHLSSELA
jgi:DNA-binding ferritin-like protein